jgi:ferredoxin
VVEMGDCVLCEGCIEVCPSVFSLNPAGYIEVAELEQYPEPEVDEAISICPANCIYWQPF